MHIGDCSHNSNRKLKGALGTHKHEREQVSTLEMLVMHGVIPEGPSTPTSSPILACPVALSTMLTRPRRVRMRCRSPLISSILRRSSDGSPIWITRRAALRPLLNVQGLPPAVYGCPALYLAPVLGLICCKFCGSQGEGACAWVLAWSLPSGECSGE